MRSLTPQRSRDEGVRRSSPRLTRRLTPIRHRISSSRSSARPSERPKDSGDLNGTDPSSSPNQAPKPTPPPSDSNVLSVSSRVPPSRSEIVYTTSNYLYFLRYLITSGPRSGNPFLCFLLSYFVEVVLSYLLIFSLHWLVFQTILSTPHPQQSPSSMIPMTSSQSFLHQIWSSTITLYQVCLLEKAMPHPFSLMLLASALQLYLTIHHLLT